MIHHVFGSDVMLDSTVTVRHFVIITVTVS